MVGPINSVVVKGSPAYKAATAAQNARARVNRSINLIPPPQTGLLTSGVPGTGRQAMPNAYVSPIFKQARALPPGPAAPPGVDPRVVTLQKNLVAQGYHISVDGIMGPQTRTALYASQHPRGTHNASVPDPNATRSPRTENGQAAQGYVGGGKPAPANHQPSVGGVKVVSGKTGQSIFPSFLNAGAKVPAWRNIPLPGYNPDELAQSTVNAKYAPILQGFDKQTQDITNAGANRQADISSAYSGSITGAQAATDAADTRVQNAANTTAALPASIAANLGLSPEMAAALAGQGIINAQDTQNAANTAIKEQDQAVQNMRLGQEYTANLAGRATDSALADVRAQRQAAVQNQGEDLASAKAQARQDYADKVTAIQEANRQGLLSTAQAKQAVNQAGRDARLTYLNTLAGAKAAGVSLAGINERAREFDISQAFNEKQLSSTNALNKLKIGAANATKADQAAQGAYKTIVGPRGWPKYGTNKAYTIAAQQLQAAGLKPGTKAYEMRMNYVMNAAHIKLGPGGKPTGLAGPRPGTVKK